MAEQYNPVDFDELSATSDGKTLLYADGQVCKSENTIGELVDSKIDGKGYAPKSFVYGEIEGLSGTVSTEYATKEELADFGGFVIAEGTGEDSHPDVQNPNVKKIYLVKKRTTKDKYCEWIWTKEEGLSENTWVLIGETTVDLSDYAKTDYVDELVAVNDEKTAGQVLTYNGTNNEWTSIISGQSQLPGYSPQNTNISVARVVMGNPADHDSDSEWSFIKAKLVSDDGQSTDNINGYLIPQDGDGILKRWTDQRGTHQRFVNDYYTKSETSGKQQLADAFNAKQDKLTFAGENNTITAINTSAVGGSVDFPTINLNGNYYLSLDKICAKKVEHSENGSEYEEVSLPNYHWTTTKNTQNNYLKFTFNKSISDYTSIILKISAYVSGSGLQPIEKELKNLAVGSTVSTMYYGQNAILKEIGNDYIILEFDVSGSTINDAYFDVYSIKTLPEDVSAYKFSTTDINCANNVINDGSHIVGNGIIGCSALTGSCIEGLKNVDCSAIGGSHIEGSANSNCSATTGSIIYGAVCKSNKAVDGSIIGGLRVSANSAVGGSFIIGNSNSGNISTGGGNFILGYNIKDCSAREGSIINGYYISSSTAYRGSYIEGYSHSGNNTDRGAYIEGSYNHNNKLTGAHIEGYHNTDNTGNYCHIEGYYNSAISAENGAHIEGSTNTNNSAKDGAHIEGYCNSSCTAFNGGHIEGVFNYSNRFDYSHIEGYRNSGCNISDGSHLEGLYNKDCTAFYGSHIEGIYNITPAATTGVSAIHLGGGYNAATNDFETVIGKCCDYTSISSNKPLFVIGNGKISPTQVRSNAMAVYETGLASATKLATSGIQDVEAKITNLESTIGNIETILQSI